MRQPWIAAVPSASAENMAPNVGSGAADIREPIQPRPKPKVTRQKPKRDGPIRLQFVTATDLSQFKDEHAKRSVRSQAMIHYRNRKVKDEKTVRQRAEKARGDIGPIDVGSRSTRDANAMQVVRKQWVEGEDYSPALTACWDDNPDTPHYVYNDLHIYSASTPVPPTYGSRQDNRPARTKFTVVKYEYTEIQEDRQMRILVAKLATFFQIGDGVDPFVVLPQFKSPELDSLYLVRRCMRAFATEPCLVKWLPAMLGHPQILLSSVVLVSTWLDLLSRCPGDSKRTRLIKAEIMAMINERLSHPEMALADTTLMIILHLLSGEMWGCDENALRTHESGIARFITQRGGLSRLENLAVAETCAACCYHCDIFCEAEQLPIFRIWEPQEYKLISDTYSIPESPVFCPRYDFITAKESPLCSTTTYELLCDMRDLTDLFIMHRSSLNCTYDIDSDSDVCLSLLAVHYDDAVSRIRERLASLPSAYTPGLPTSNDWVYEACRITAIIYAGSIILQEPFSTAANPQRNPILSGSADPLDPSTIGIKPTKHLSTTLYDMLQRTDIANVWNDMSGVFYWACSVGAAAARLPTIVGTMQQLQGRSDTALMWARRCLTMYSMRAMIVLVFEHPNPVILAQKRLLMVQELIGTYTKGRTER